MNALDVLARENHPTPTGRRAQHRYPEPALATLVWRQLARTARQLTRRH